MRRASSRPPHLIEACNTIASYVPRELHTKGWHPIGPNSPKAICFGFIHWHSQAWQHFLYFTAMPQDSWLDLAWKPYYGWERRKRGIWFLQKNRTWICVSVCAQSGFGDVFTCCLRLRWDVYDSLPVPDPIWTKRLSQLRVSAAKQVFLFQEQKNTWRW